MTARYEQRVPPKAHERSASPGTGKPVVRFYDAALRRADHDQQLINAKEY
ncbi:MULTISPECIES: hypothetical protein [unclassified Curtobacterium]|nr:MULTISPECIES: hypothetical protein [unclassified Curtobacterium]